MNWNKGTDKSSIDFQTLFKKNLIVKSSQGYFLQTYICIIYDLNTE